MFKQNLFKHLLSILAVVSIASFAGVDASYAEVPVETGDVAGDIGKQKEKCEKSGGTWGDDVCQCAKKANTVEKDGMCVCKDGYKLDGAESLAEENARCVVDENSGTGSTETPTGSDPVGAATGIKIATKSFNDARFSYVRRDLDNTIATIRDVVSNAITNTNNIAALQDGKQTRPDDNHACAEGKTCLLVTDTSGTRNWYEIIDCGKTLPSFGTYNGENVHSGLYGPGEPWGYSVTGQTGDKLMCQSGVIACNNNEWVTPYSKALVYGTARRVGIAEQTPGTVVKLPTNVQSGNVCVCKATRYRMYTGDLRPQGQTAVIGDDQSISTDDWFVAGVASNDEGCFSMCGADAHYGSSVSKLSYLAGISNTCMAAANTAQMCVYDEFLNGLYAGLTATSGSGQMTLLADSQGVSGVRVYGSCNSSGDFYNDNDICGTNAANPGAWVAGPVSATGNAVYDGAIVYGKSRCVDATEALNALSDFDVVYLDNAPSASSTGTVCLHNITGYKPGNGSKTAVAADAQKVWIVKKYNSAAECNASGGDGVVSGCYGESWTENFLRTGHYDFYGRVADVCAAN